MTPEDYRRVLEFQSNLTVGMPVTVRWGYGLGFRAEGKGVISDIFPGSVRVRLTEDVSIHGNEKPDWPTGHVLKGIPLLTLANHTRWDYWHSVSAA